MKLLSGRIAGWCFAVLALGAVTFGVARATNNEPPSKMEVGVAIRLDRDLAHIREAEAQCAHAKESGRPYDEDAVSILKTYKIDSGLFNRGVITVDYVTGEIKRPPVEKPSASKKP